MVNDKDQPSTRLSVITPSYNQVQFIEKTINSVLSQRPGFTFEYIIVDGGSADGTLDVLKRYINTIHCISEPDSGMQDALNKGFAAAKGDVIGWLNSDDIYLPGALEKVMTYFDRNPDCLWLFGNCRIIDDQDREIRKWISQYKNWSSRRYSYERLLGENFIPQPAVFIRRGALEKAGPVDPGLPTAMDFDLWLRLAKLGKPGYIDDYLACFRTHNQSISSKHYKIQFEEQYRIHARYDRRRFLLLKHRAKIRLIVSAYSILEKIQHLSGEPE